MSVKIAGMGWVTPLGAGLDEVWEKIEAGQKPAPAEIATPQPGRTHRALVVPPKTADAVGRNPRLRRSSPITYYSVTAALAALENAGITMTPEIAERTAVVFGVCSGGVIYTRKFYEMIVKQGANAASPLLFPETVYNAPASHAAALIGVTGMSYTLVGDGTVGISAIKFGEQLLATTDIDYCVVATGEEMDWVLCEAYHEWRIPALLAEGGAAVVLAREGRIALGPVHPGVSFTSRKEAGAAIRKVHHDLAADVPRPDLIVGSANDTFIDALEARALKEEYHPGTATAYPKHYLGEMLAAGALAQTVFGAFAMQKRSLNNVIVSALGFNQQATGLALSQAL